MEKEIPIRYLVASERDQLWGLSVSSAGFQQIRPHTHYPQKNHPSKYLFSFEKGRVLDEYALVYITHGSGTYCSKWKKNVPLKAGDILLLFPDEWHSYRPQDSTGWDEYWICFKGPTMDEWVKNEFFSNKQHLYSVGINMEIVQLYKYAIATAIKQPLGFQHILAGITELILATMNTLDKSRTGEYQQMGHQINRAKMLIYEKYQTEINMQAIANEVCMSYSYFRHLFKKHTGLSPNQYLQELRIQKSKELLVSTDLPCQEIAYRIGYDNPVYFSVLFKKMTHLSPTEYRKLYQPK